MLHHVGVDILVQVLSYLYMLPGQGQLPDCALVSATFYDSYCSVPNP